MSLSRAGATRPGTVASTIHRSRTLAGEIVLGDVYSIENVHDATTWAEAVVHLAVATGPNH